jgi:hypothetical protein
MHYDITATQVAQPKWHHVFLWVLEIWFVIGIGLSVDKHCLCLLHLSTAHLDVALGLNHFAQELDGDREHRFVEFQPAVQTIEDAQDDRAYTQIVLVLSFWVIDWCVLVAVRKYSVFFPACCRFLSLEYLAVVN